MSADQPNSMNPSNRPGPLGATVLRGAGTLGMLRVGTGTLSAFVQIVVIANLLGPAKMGLFIYVLLVLRFLDIFAQTGFERALVQRSGDIQSHLNTAFTFHILRGCFIASIIYFGAPWIAQFFGNPPGLVQPLQVMALVPFIQGLRNLGIVFLKRRLEFKRIVLINSAKPLTELTVSVGIALVQPTIWALVYGALAGVVANVVLTYLVAPERPRLDFHWMRFRELHSFGVWVFLSGIVAFCFLKGGEVVVAKMLPQAVLGIYGIADTLACRPTVELTHVINQVTFLAFSKIHDDQPRLRRAFTKSFSRVCSFVFLMTALLIVGAPDFVNGILSPEWNEAIPIIQVLAIWGASRALGAVSSSLYQAIGRPALATLFQFVILVLFLAAIIPAARQFGAMGVATTLAIVGSLVQALRVPLLARVLGGSARPLYLILLATVSSAACAVLAATTLGHSLGAIHTVVRLGLVLVATGGVYAGGLALWDRILNNDYTLIPRITRPTAG